MMQLYQALKKTDDRIGKTCLTLFRKAEGKPVTPTPPMRILVIRPGGMGDAALLLPVFKAIKKKDSRSEIHVLCEARNAGIFQATPYVDKLYLYTNPRELISVLTTSYDVVVDTEQSHYLSAILAGMIQAGVKAGFKVNGREKIYHYAVPYHHNLYEAESFWDLFRKLCLIDGPFAFDPPYFKHPSNNTIFNHIPEKSVCIFPGATIPERKWPEKRWAAVIDQLADSGRHCCLLGGKNERDQCRLIISSCKTGKIHNFCGKLSLLETAGLFQKAALLISTDSGILHLGVLSGIPTISLFGPGIAAKWAPTGEQHSTINKNLECSPCTLFGTTPKCRNGNRCMTEIRVDDIMNSITAFNMG